MPRSEHADRFDHDPQAPDYDRGVLDESHPVRAGYAACLDWVARRAAVDADCAVLELGVGTGNLTLRLPRCRRLVCVDVSENMIREAQAKLSSAVHISWVRGDLLECFDGLHDTFDRIVSTYAIHHLTDREKGVLFEKIQLALRPGGIAAFGDLMFESERSRLDLLERLRRDGPSALADAIGEEFYWNVELATAELARLGLRTTAERISELSWGVEARKPR